MEYLIDLLFSTMATLGFGNDEEQLNVWRILIFLALAAAALLAVAWWYRLI